MRSLFEEAQLPSRIIQDRVSDYGRTGLYQIAQKPPCYPRHRNALSAVLQRLRSPDTVQTGSDTVCFYTLHSV